MSGGDGSQNREMVLMCAVCQRNEAVGESILLNTKGEAIGKLGYCKKCSEIVKDADILIRSRRDADILRTLQQWESDHAS